VRHNKVKKEWRRLWLKEVDNRVIATWKQVAYPLKGLLDVIHGLKACMVISVKLLVLKRSLVVSEHIAPACMHCYYSSIIPLLGITIVSTTSPTAVLASIL
jgi:hypothetical protein